jgi:2-isopropylmalate synthase
VHDYAEHAVSSGTNAQAAAYVEARAVDGVICWGIGIDESILAASLKAVISAVNRLRAASQSTDEGAIGILPG